MSDDIRRFARGVIDAEADAVRSTHQAVEAEDFPRAVALLLYLTGAAVVTGVGKAGHVARKTAATLASTGTPAHFLSPGDALHGDLGSVRRDDAVIFFSASGTTDELVRLLGVVRRLGLATLAVTASRDTPLGRDAGLVLPIGRVAEACPLQLAPSCSTTAMLAVGDALALSVMRERRFTADDFALYHPAGNLGRRLLRVSEAMGFTAGRNLPLASPDDTVSQVLRSASTFTRRPGAVVVVDEACVLAGIFSDGDLRRLLVSDPSNVLARRIGDVMTRDPKRVRGDAPASEAVAVMRASRIDELPVVDASGVVVGLVDVQDLVVLKVFDEKG